MRYALALLSILSVTPQAPAQKMILDADTGNELDDLYALTYMLRAVDDNIIALNAAHFNNVDLLTYDKWNGYETKGLNTMQASYELNKTLLKYTGRTDIKCLKGTNKIIGRAWGGEAPRPSEASKVIIEEALIMKENEKLVVFTIGPVTNVASAVIENPAIQDKIVLYMMGSDYYPDKEVWNKSSFNVNNDLNAFNYLLNSEVEMHVLPKSTARKLRFNKKRTLENHNSGSALDKLLTDRWDHVNAGDSWIMWDLALFIAYLQPELAMEIEVDTPPENKPRKVFVYVDIDADKMEENFWELYQAKFQNMEK